MPLLDGKLLELLEYGLRIGLIGKYENVVLCSIQVSVDTRHKVWVKQTSTPENNPSELVDPWLVLDNHVTVLRGNREGNENLNERIDENAFELRKRGGGLLEVILDALKTPDDFLEEVFYGIIKRTYALRGLYRMRS